MDGKCNGVNPFPPLPSDTVPKSESQPKPKEEQWKIMENPRHPITEINQNFLKNKLDESWGSSTISLLSTVTYNEADIHLKMRRNLTKIQTPGIDNQGNKIQETESTRTLGVSTMDFTELINPGKRSLISIGWSNDKSNKKSDIQIIYNSPSDEEEESEDEEGFRRDSSWRNFISLIICLIFFIIIPLSTLVIYFAYFYDSMSNVSVKPGLFETHLSFS